MKRKVVIKTLNLLISKRCNLRCRMCDYRLGSFFVKELSIDQVKSLINQAADLGLEQLELSGGEPMMYKGIYEIIAYAKTKGIKVLMMTNGVLIGEAEVEKLILSGLSGVVVSLEGFEEINDKIRGLGNFQRAVKALKEFQKRKEQLDVVKVGTTISKYNYEYILSFTQYIFMETGVNCFSYNPFKKEMLYKTNYLERKDEFILSREMLPRLEEEINRLIEYGNRVGIDLPNEAFLKKIPSYFADEVMVPAQGCTIPLNGCAVDAGGKVYACWGEPVITGDLTKNSLKEIITADQYQAQCERGIKRLCRGCLSACYTDIHR